MGNAFLTVLRWVLLVFAGLYTMHFAFIAFDGLIKPFARYHDTEKKHHFAILIPVRNEEHVIGSLLDSIGKADYPHDLLDVYVLVNNTTDHTPDIARSYGAHVIDYGNTVHSKGDVLGRAFTELTKHKQLDAFAIFDALISSQRDLTSALYISMNRCRSSLHTAIKITIFACPSPHEMPFGLTKIEATVLLEFISMEWGTANWLKKQVEDRLSRCKTESQKSPCT